MVVSEEAKDYARTSVGIENHYVNNWKCRLKDIQD